MNKDEIGGVVVFAVIGAILLILGLTGVLWFGVCYFLGSIAFAFASLGYLATKDDFEHSASWHTYFAVGIQAIILGLLPISIYGDNPIIRLDVDDWVPTLIILEMICLIGVGVFASGYGLRLLITNKSPKEENKTWRTSILVGSYIPMIILISIGINYTQSYRWRKEFIARKAAMEEATSTMAARDVELGFMGFKLGGLFSESVENAKQNTDITITKTDEESVEFSSYLDGHAVDCKICSFQDTITSLIILSTDPTIQGIQYIYKEKYGDWLNGGYDKWEWRFKNTGIQIATHKRTEEKGIRVKEGHENLNPENLQNYEVVTETYFVMQSITYNDFRQIEKVEKFEQMEQAKRDSLKKIRDKIRQDSLKLVRDSLDAVRQQEKAKTLDMI